MRLNSDSFPFLKSAKNPWSILYARHCFSWRQYAMALCTCLIALFYTYVMSVCMKNRLNPLWSHPPLLDHEDSEFPFQSTPCMLPLSFSSIPLGNEFVNISANWFFVLISRTSILYCLTCSTKCQYLMLIILNQGLNLWVLASSSATLFIFKYLAIYLRLTAKLLNLAN